MAGFRSHQHRSLGRRFSLPRDALAIVQRYYIRYAHARHDDLLHASRLECPQTLWDTRQYALVWETRCAFDMTKGMIYLADTGGTQLREFWWIRPERLGKESMRILATFFLFLYERNVNLLGQMMCAHLAREERMIACIEKEIAEGATMSEDAQGTNCISTKVQEREFRKLICEMIQDTEREVNQNAFHRPKNTSSSFTQ